MNTNRTRAEQVVEAFRRMNPDGPSLGDRIEQALEEAVRDALLDWKPYSAILLQYRKKGTLAGLEMAADYLENTAWIHLTEGEIFAEKIRAKAKELLANELT